MLLEELGLQELLKDECDGSSYSQPVESDFPFRLDTLRCSGPSAVVSQANRPVRRVLR